MSAEERGDYEMPVRKNEYGVEHICSGPFCEVCTRELLERWEWSPKRLRDGYCEGV